MPNFTYTTNIPFATNDPSVDQPVMQTNTNSTASIVSVDLIGFNNNNGGYHSKATLIDQLGALTNPATSPASGVLYSNSAGASPFPADANPELYYVNNAGQKKLSGNILVASGSISPNGSYNVFQTPWGIKIFTGSFSISNGSFTYTLSGATFGATVYTTLVSETGQVDTTKSGPWGMSANAGASTFGAYFAPATTGFMNFLVLTS